MKSKITKGYRFTYILINKAYEGLKLLFDPAIEGDPYIMDKVESKLSQIKRPLISFKKMNWR